MYIHTLENCMLLCQTHMCVELHLRRQYSFRFTKTEPPPSTIEKILLQLRTIGLTRETEAMKATKAANLSAKVIVKTAHIKIIQNETVFK